MTLAAVLNGGGPAVTLSPTSLGFGNQVINTTSVAKTVTLTNSGTAALNISSITTSGDFAIFSKTCGSTLAVRAKCAVKVTFTPTVLGNGAWCYDGRMVASTARTRRSAPLDLDRSKAKYRWSQAFPALPCIVMLLAFPSAAQTETKRTYEQMVCDRFALEDASIPVTIRQALNSPPKKQVRDPQQRLWQASSNGLVEVESPGMKKLWTGKDGLPILSLTGVALGPDGRLWLTTREGAICFQPDAPAGQQWFYFWGKRYLSDNRVAQIVAEKDRAWVRTQTGVSLIEFEPFDLERKSALFVERLQSRHNRYGYTADCELLRPGDTSSFRLAPSDNDGLWTAIYVTAECFRFAATHSPQALRNARLSLAALLRLESITGIPGFPARALIHRGDYRAPDGEWHWTADGEWEWKGDTSSDELVGHFLAYAVAYDLLPDESQRAAIRVAAGRIAAHLLDHGLQLVGLGGRVTTWGKYSPACT